ncbi:MAG: hypothetical protein E7493_05825 [Ruminococcus albus]|nr:hypothetical protein [Ruminococcus albus]
MSNNENKGKSKAGIAVAGIVALAAAGGAYMYNTGSLDSFIGGTAESQAEAQADARVPANSAEETSDTGNGDDSTDSMNENAKAEMIEVTVSEDKYIFEDKVMDIDELKGIIEGKEGAVVKITDENSTLNAYKDLTAYLEERGIEFTEENN